MIFQQPVSVFTVKNQQLVINLRTVDIIFKNRQYENYMLSQVLLMAFEHLW